MREFDAYCDTCYGYWAGCQIVPIIGTVCPTCLARLSDSHVLTGCIEGSSILHLAELMELEIKQRTENLKIKARMVIKGKLDVGEASEKQSVSGQTTRDLPDGH